MSHTTFRIINNSDHTTDLSFYDKSGNVGLSIRLEDELVYEKIFDHTISCCGGCFLSQSDSVVFIYDDTIRVNHYLYNKAFPSNNIYNSFYYDIVDTVIEDNCFFTYTIKQEDYIEALENIK